MQRKLFIAGASGATGKVLTTLALERGVEFIAHYRPARGSPPELVQRAAVFELTDVAALDSALRGCTTVLQLIGTMRDRFARGDTYASSDVGTTRLLVEAARRTGVDHFILLSSVGAGLPVGAYLKAKADAEALVVGSGIAFTTFRPSALRGVGRPVPSVAVTLTKALGLDRFRPVELTELSAALLSCALEREPLGAVLEGKALWAQVAHARSARATP